MRIAYLSYSPIPSREANSIHVMRMCHAFAAAGHEVTLTARQGEASEASDFNLYGVSNSFAIIKSRIFRSPLWSYPYALAAAAAVRRRCHPELVYGRDLQSLAAAAALGVPLVLEAHAPPLARDRLVQRWLLRRPNFARLVVISDALRREFQRRYPRMPRQRILVAHDAADAPRDPPDADILARVRRPEGRLNVGYIGHLYPGKGMEVVAELAVRLPEVEFHVVGGTESDVAQWRKRTAGSGNLNYYGFVPPRLTDSYRQAMDVLLAPYQTRVTVGGRGDTSRWMSPLKIFEYMAARKPIVASDLPVLREVLTDGKEALLAPPGDPDAWEVAVRRLTAPELREELAASAFAAFENKYTWAARGRTVLDNLFARPPSGGTLETSRP